MGHARAGELLEDLGADVRDRAIALGGIVELAGVGLGIGDEFLEVVDRHRRVHRHHIGGHRHQPHGHQVLEVPGQLVHQDGVGNVVARIRHQQGVTVFGCLPGHLSVGQVAAGPGLVVHHHRVAHDLAQGVGHQAGRGVDQAARRVGHDQIDGFAGKALGQGDLAQAQGADGQPVAQVGMQGFHGCLQVSSKVGRLGSPGVWLARTGQSQCRCLSAC